MALGQYHKGDSVLHRMDPRFKLVIAVVYMLVIFLASDAVGLALVLAFLGIAVALSGVPARVLLSGLRPVLALVVFTFMVNLIFIRSGTPLLDAGPVSVTTGGLSTALFMATRLLALFVATALLGFTTSSVDLADGMEGLLAPLERFGVPAHELSMMLSIALRFIPILMTEKDRIMRAQSARGADFETGNVVTRMRAVLPVLTPLFMSAFRHAEDLSTAMESRCYHGKEGRTRVKVLRPEPRDWYAVGALALLFAALVTLRLGGL